MKNLLSKISTTPKSVSLRETFKSSFDGVSILISQPKFFILSIILSTFILISFLVPIAAFIAIPGVISVFIAIVFSYVNNEDLKLYRILQIMNYKYPFKISTFACLVIVPAVIILGIGMYTYSNVSISPENILKISPSVVYLIIATTMFTLAWGVAYFSANCFALQNDASMISVCTDAIEQVIKKPLNMFVMCITWFMSIMFFYFLVACTFLVLSMFAPSLNVWVYTILCYVIAFFYSALFISFYFMNLAVYTYKMFAVNFNDHDDSELDSSDSHEIQEK